MPKTFFLWLILWIVLPVANQNTLAQAQTDHQNPADSILKKARELREQNQPSDWHAALACYETLLGQPSLKVSPDELARLYFETGQLYLQVGNLPQAIDRLSIASEIYQANQDPLNQAKILNYLGAVYLQQGNLEKAADSFTRSVARCRQMNSLEGLTVSLSNLGNACIQLNQYSVAEHHFLEVLALREKADDRLGQAITLYNLARIYEIQGLESKAQDTFARSAGYFQNKQVAPLAKATIFSGYGMFLINQEKYTESLPYLEEACELFRSSGDPHGQVLTLTSLGSIALSQGLYQKAFNLGQQALEIAQQTGNPESLQHCNFLLGNCHLWYSQHQRAASHFQIGLEQARLTKDLYRQSQFLDELGVASFYEKHYQEAIQYHRQALAINQKLGNKRAQANSFHNLGAAFFEQGRFQEALGYLNSARELFESLQFRLGLAECYLQRSIVYVAAKQPAQAEVELRQAARWANQSGNTYLEARVNFQVAEFERSRNKPEQALAAVNQAIALAEFIRGNAGSSPQRSSFFSSVQKFFDLKLLILLDFYHRSPTPALVEEMFLVREQAHARSLLDDLTTQKPQPVDTSGSVWLKERALRDDIAAKYALLSELFGQSHSESQEQKLKDELEELLAEHRKIQGQIRGSLDPKTAALAPSQITLKELQALLDSKTCLIEFAPTNENCLVWVIDHRSINFFEIKGMNRATLSRLVTQIHQQVSQTGQNRGLYHPSGGGEPVLTKPALMLSQKLFKPLAPFFKPSMLFVPGDSLFALPLAVLPDPSTRKRQYLIQTRKIGVLPSATLLKYFKKTPFHAEELHQITVFADPMYSVTDPRFKPGMPVPRETSADQKSRLLAREDVAPGKLSAPSTRLEIPRLPWTQLEAEKIKELAGSATRLKTGVEASVAEVKRTPPDSVQILHFATHGMPDPVYPDLSALVLALIDAEGNPVDGFLRSAEISDLNLSSGLVVLSACQTGIGKEVRGEGLLSLTRSFLVAGTQRVVYTLWSVNDQATAQFMERFYFHLLVEKQDPGEALRQAQLDLAQSRQWHDPFYWAAFQLQGSPF